MTLLEAFVYDPLVDWTPGLDLRLAAGGGLVANQQVAGGGGGGGEDALQDKRDLQTELTFSMLAVRVAEIKSRWLENQVQVNNVLGTGLEDGFNYWQEIYLNMQNSNETLSRLHLAMSSLKEAESNPGHRLYMLQNRFVEHNMVEAAVKVAQAKVAAFVQDHEKWVHLHQRAEACLTPEQMSRWTNDVADIPATTTCDASGVVQEFLDNAGQSSLLEQIQLSEAAFSKGLEKLQQDLQTCVLLLGHYSSIYNLYPASHKSGHRTSRYIQWMKQIAEDFTNETCHLVHQEFTTSYDDQTSDAHR